MPKNKYRSARSTGLGLGNKYDFTKNAKDTPAPGAYNIKRAHSHTAYSFGLSRDVNRVFNSLASKLASPS